MWRLQKDRYKWMRQVGSYITYLLSHLCTHAHKCACVHTHTHTNAHILIHITHTQQPLYSVRTLYLPVQILGVTHGTHVGQCIRTVNPHAIAKSHWPELHRSSRRSEIPRPDHSSTIYYFDWSLVTFSIGHHILRLDHTPIDVMANSRWPEIPRSSRRSEIHRPDHSYTIDNFDRSYKKDRYKRMRQLGSYITYPLSHLCTHAHKCACVHTHTHTHAHIHTHYPYTTTTL